MKKTLNLCIIGAGAVFRLMHLPALLNLNDKFRIKSVYDPDPKALSKTAKVLSRRTKDPMFTACPAEILSDEGIDAVAVLTPTSAHFRYTIDSLKKRKHVFLEKPAAVNLQDVKKIITAERKYRRFVQVGMVLRYSSFYLELKKLIDSGKYGKVLWMNWLETRPFDPMLWRYNNTKLNGDAIIHDKAIHQINLFNDFAGAKPKCVLASGGQYLLSGSRYSKVRAFSSEVKLKGESCDHLMAIIEYKNKVKASLTVSYVSPHARESRWIIQLESAKIVAHFETFVSRSPGTKHKWNGNPSCIYLFKDNRNQEIPWKHPMSYPPQDKNLVFYDEYKNEPLHPGSTAQWIAFYDSIINNRKPVCNTALALEDIAAANAIASSIKKGKVIRLQKSLRLL
ncbi:MAG: Gfo/Idh/MocA family oxidoreductase [Ignavibacteria bacterium]|nr:Gfo/Idh/MocA family oxidoreductase [Ignavibacteria bacterium]